MPRTYTSANTDEKLKRTKLAMERLKLEQARHEWKKATTPRPPGMAEYEFSNTKLYKEMVSKLDEIRYTTRLYELAELTSRKEKQMVETQISALHTATKIDAWKQKHEPEILAVGKLVPCPGADEIDDSQAPIG